MEYRFASSSQLPPTNPPKIRSYYPEEDKFDLEDLKYRLQVIMGQCDFYYKFFKEQLEEINNIPEALYHQELKDIKEKLVFETSKGNENIIQIYFDAKKEKEYIDDTGYLTESTYKEIHEKLIKWEEYVKSLQKVGMEVKPAIEIAKQNENDDLFNKKKEEFKGKTKDINETTLLDFKTKFLYKRIMGIDTNRVGIISTLKELEKNIAEFDAAYEEYKVKYEALTERKKALKERYDALEKKVADTLTLIEQSNATDKSLIRIDLMGIDPYLDMLFILWQEVESTRNNSVEIVDSILDNFEKKLEQSEKYADPILESVIAKCGDVSKEQENENYYIELMKFIERIQITSGSKGITGELAEFIKYNANPENTTKEDFERCKEIINKAIYCSMLVEEDQKKYIEEIERFKESFGCPQVADIHELK